MTNIDLTTALTRLLSDRRTRQAFAENREKLADQLSVAAADRAALVALDVDELERQADCLLQKRFHEVAALLPWTMPALGGEAKSLFREFADGFWPAGHRRHLLDAIAFCSFLDLRPNGVVNRYEWNCLRFLVAKQRVSITFVTDYLVAGERRAAIQLLYRTREGRPKDVACDLRWFTAPFLAKRRPS